MDVLVTEVKKRDRGKEMLKLIIIEVKQGFLWG